MTTLREAAQQALEALKDDQYRLVEVSPNQYEYKTDLLVEVGPNQYEYKTDLAIAALERALAQQAEPVEPVAWVRLEAWKSGQSWPDDCFTALPAEGLTPLYTAPPQRKPLTEEQIKACEQQAMVNGALPFEQRALFARAIEKAHGIE